MSIYFVYTPLTPNTVARAADVNSRFNGVSAAFDLLPSPTLLSEDRTTYATDSGTANTYVATLSLPITAYNTGLRVRLKANAGNTGASTINVSGLGVKQIVRSDGTALIAGDIVTNQILDLTYDGSSFRLAMAFAEMSPAGVATKVAAAGNITVNGALTATSGITNNGVTLNGLTSFGVSLATAANAAGGRSALGLGSMALATATDYAGLNSPAFFGVPTAPTAAPGTNSTQLATTAYVAAAIGGVSGFAPVNSPSFTGTPSAPTPATGDNTTQLATTAYVKANLASYATVGSLGAYAPLSSPALTGTPTAPTAAGGTNNTQIATTAFVQAAVSGGGGGYAPLASPTFTGTPSGPTPATGTNSTQFATTAYVQANLTNYVTTGSLSGYAPISSPNFSGTPSVPTPAGGDNSGQIPNTNWVWARLGGYATTGSLAAYATLASPNFSGTPAVPTPAAGDNSGQIPNTNWVWARLGGYATTTSLASYAPLASPGFSGTPAAPTAAPGTNTSQLATTAFVDRLRSLPSRVDNAATAAATDRGGNIFSQGSVTINSGVFSAGDVISVTNFNTGSTASIIQGSGMTLRLAGTSSTGTRTLSQMGMATILFVDGSNALVSGNVT